MRFLFFCQILVLLLKSGGLLAQTKGWQELTISDGLSQGMIFDIQQDKKGFIWVATKDGLNRYDGHNFKVFTHDPYNASTLSENVCTALLIDRHQRIWVGTKSKGLDLLNPETGRFYHITINDEAIDKASSFAITQLVEDPDGNIWIGTENDRLVKVSLPDSLQNGFPDQADFTHLVKRTSVPLQDVNQGTAPRWFAFVQRQQLLAYTWKNLYAVNWKKPVSPRKLDFFKADISLIMTAYADTSQNYWFVIIQNRLISWHNGKLHSAYLSTDGSIRVHLKALDQQRIAVLTTDHLWIMSPDELFRQDSLTRKNAYVDLPPNTFGVSSLFEDQTGNIWIGTMGYGLRKFNPRIRQFHSYLPNRSLSHISIDKKGRTYFQFYDGFEQFDRSGQRTYPFIQPAPFWTEKPEWFILPDRQGFFWTFNSRNKRNDINADNNSQRLLKYSTDWKLLRTYVLPPGCRLGAIGNQTLEDPAGNLWIGTVNGKLLRFNPQSEQFQVFDYTALFPRIGAQIEVYSLLLEPDSTLWIGTDQGLVRVRSLASKPTFTLFRNLLQNPKSLSDDFVLSLCLDPNQPQRYLWVGTKGGGLDRLDKQMGQFDHVTEKQGLPNKVVYGILADNAHHLWMSTNRGIAQFNPKTGKFRTYTKNEGLQDDEFNNQSYAKLTTGELLFGGINGVSIFQPSEIVTGNQQTPKVAIVGLKINNKPVEIDGPEGILAVGIEFTNELNLRYDQNLVTLEFGVMDLTNPKSNRYRYWLDGIDQDWVDAGTNRFANYAQLPPGSYHLKMMGSVDGEHWSRPIELRIRVQPPFYRTWWAYLVYLGMLSLLIWLFIRLQAQRLVLQQQVAFKQQEASRLAELDAIKTQFFTNISHEFRTPLTLILGPLADLKKRFPGDMMLTLMERNSNRLMALINQLLDLSKLEAGELHPEMAPGDIAAFLRTLASSFTSLAISRTIQFTFEQSLATYWTRFDRDKVEKIVNNLLSNAFKFTPERQSVRMRVEYETKAVVGTMTLQVEDSGIGIPAANLPKIFDRFYQVEGEINRVGGPRTYEGTGIGLALVYELVNVLDGTIDVSSTEGVGTTFTVKLPLELVNQTGTEPTYTDVTSADLAVTPPPAIQATKDPRPLSSNSIPPATTSTDNVLLIIDDNDDIRAYLRAVFEREYQIVEAEDGQQGLERATELTPSLVICDLMMPRLDGFGFCRALKTQEATSHIPVVMLTAKATVQDRMEGFELGADEYLAKPFNADEIRVRVRNLLDKQERLRQYFGKQPVSTSIVSVATDATPVLSREAIFLQKVRQVVESHYADSTFGTDELSQAMNLSSSQLLRKLKALTGLTAVEFLRQYRLERAATLLAGRAGTVSEIAYQVGFESLSYFTRTFQERYGVSPSDYAS
ncbi:hybrid sensor histidine kinase/response regulator transcription factor [Spirosoma gilvum]